MTSFAQRCGLHDAPRAAACEQVLQSIAEARIERVRIAWCDLHGALRGKTLMAHAVAAALQDGIGLVSTVMLKDTSDRTAFQVFDPGLADELPGFGQANNLVLLPDPASFRVLPWAQSTAWMQAQPWFDHGEPVRLDTRRVLQTALGRLADEGYGLRCGLEVEFHIYRIDDPRLDPHRAAWPGEPPAVSMIHPGYNLLAEDWSDMADEPLQIVQRTAQGLNLPLRSVEIELGPSQVEAVFGATDALTAADHMVLFRNGVRQALRRHGYHASFVCRPPFPNVMASGWHLHQSLVHRDSGVNAMRRDAPAPGAEMRDAAFTLSTAGERYLAGLLAHGRGMAALCTPTINGFGRFRPHAMAPQSVLWGRDNRGAMLRVLGRRGDPATRIENRIGEPSANPYLYVAAQIYAGLDGLRQCLSAPAATDSPYAAVAMPLPTSLGEALDALANDAALVDAFGAPLIECFTRIKRAELARYDEAADKDDWQRREYFGRF
ncbi:MAG TPA: glutamine synthetase family protein [Burkholderiaceae bacterium]|nr:glutamine synthetase family protein [Burkholderiaceae bacterium]